MWIKQRRLSIQVWISNNFFKLEVYKLTKKRCLLTASLCFHVYVYQNWKLCRNQNWNGKWFAMYWFIWRRWLKLNFYFLASMWWLRNATIKLNFYQNYSCIIWSNLILICLWSFDCQDRKDDIYNRLTRNYLFRGAEIICHFV